MIYTIMIGMWMVLRPKQLWTEEIDQLLFWNHLLCWKMERYWYLLWKKREYLVTLTLEKIKYCYWIRINICILLINLYYKISWRKKKTFFFQLKINHPSRKRMTSPRLIDNQYIKRCKTSIRPSIRFIYCSNNSSTSAMTINHKLLENTTIKTSSSKVSSLELL